VLSAVFSADVESLSNRSTAHSAGSHENIIVNNHSFPNNAASTQGVPNASSSQIRNLRSPNSNPNAINANPIIPLRPLPEEPAPMSSAMILYAANASPTAPNASTAAAHNTRAFITGFSPDP